MGPLPTGREQARYAIITIDYFTKWNKVEPLTIISEKKTTNFVKRDIFCRYSIPQIIITDNEKQFDNSNFWSLCVDLNIDLRFSSPVHPKTNGQVKAVNKIIKKSLKTRLWEHKGAWVDELPEVY